MLDPEEVIALLPRIAAPPRIERVPLSQAHGRVLARAVLARRTSPAFDVAAMDGIAIASETLSAPVSFEIVGESHAGEPYRGTLAPGQAIRIATGAALPAGADRVIPREQLSADGGKVCVVTTAGRDHVRRAGADFKRGDVLAESGTVLTPRRLVAAAAGDHGELAVFARPRVAIIASGDELRAPGWCGRGTAIPDSLSDAIAALAERYGGEVVDACRTIDDEHDLERAAEQALAAADIVVMIGGSSVGDRDLARAALERQGVALEVQGVRMKPGKPFWMGRVGQRVVVGLPGNPGAAFVSARLFLAPLLALMSGGEVGDALSWRAERLVAALPCGSDRTSFIFARRSAGGVQAIAEQDSSFQSSLARADVIIRREPGAYALATGAEVSVLSLD